MQSVARAMSSAAAPMTRFAALAARIRHTAASCSSASSAASSPAPPISFRGVFPILATPFRADESLDVDGFRRTVEFMADAGVNGVTVVGVLGESNRLVDAERAQLIATAVDVAKSRNAATGTPGEVPWCALLRAWLAGCCNRGSSPGSRSLVRRRRTTQWHGSQS